MNLQAREPFGKDVLLALAAIALHPSLRRVLAFGASPEELDAAAGVLERMLAAATGSPVRRITLATFHSEDQLWGLGAGLPVFWRRPGLLVPEEKEPGWRLVVIPDLAGLSLPAIRACLQLLETDLGRLERHGQSRLWEPRLAWLAACRPEAIGQVSPHLLDRFPVRLHAGKWRELDRLQSLRRWLSSETSEGNQPEVQTLASQLAEAIRRRKNHVPRLLPETIDAVLESASRWQAEGARRSLGLARLAWALAQLEGAAEVRSDHASTAASLIQGFEQSLSPPGEDALRPFEESQPVTTDPVQTAETPSETQGSPAITADGQQDAGHEAVPAFVSDSQAFPEISLPGPAEDPSPFLEDRSPAERPYASPRLPQDRALDRTREKGSIIGPRPTRASGELAILPTLLAATRFQKLRRRSGKNGHRLIVSGADWRAWKRSPLPEDLLVLVLDLTACGDCDWSAALLPYVQDAYVRRSAVCLILVGAEGAPNELRPEKILARSILVPEIRTALERRPGRASPLAAGLQLAFEVIRDARHRGRGAVLRAILLVLSDGRGNIPLEASRVGRLDGPVGRQGFQDTLEVARNLRALDRVEAVLLDPQPVYARHMVTELADALGAWIEPVSSKTILPSTEEVLQ